MLSKKSEQGNLAFVHRTAPTTKKAFAVALNKRSQRTVAIENHLLMAGPNGLTRHQISDLMGVPLSSACSVVAKMLADDRIAETGETRLSPFGQPAKIVYLKRFANP